MTDNPDKERLIHVLLREDLGQERPPDVRERVMTRIRATRGRVIRANAWRRLTAAAAAVLVVSTVLFFMFVSPFSPAPRYPVIAQTGTGTVLLRGGKPVPLSEGTALVPGDVLQTGTEGKLEIGYHEERTTLRLGKQSRLGLTSARRGKRFLLQEGILECTVATQPKSGSLVVGTPMASAKVVGTRFAMTSYPERTRVDVLEGSVNLRHGKTGRSAIVTPGLMGTVGIHHRDVRLFRKNPVTRGLVTYLPLDGTGKAAEDHSGWKNHGQIAGNARRRAGYRDGALHFDGSGDWMELTNKDISPGTPFTISFWVDIDLAPKYPNRTILSLAWPGAPAISRISMQRARGMGELRFHHPDGAVLVFGQREYPWVQLSVVHNNGKLKLYWNGKLAASHQGLKPIAFDRCLFGKMPAGNQYFCGSIDEFRLYNRALSPEEVSTLYMSDLPISK